MRASVADWLWAGWLESVTLNVSNVAFTAAVGVPLITPPAERLNPAGSVPDVSDHVYGGVPPLAAKLVV